MSEEYYDNPTWERKWFETGGYLFGRDTFSANDLVNARLRYGVETDHYLIRYIRKNIHEIMDRTTLWSGIAAEAESFYSMNDWKHFKSRGDDLHEAAMLQFLGSEQENPYLSGYEIALQKSNITAELKERGFFPDKPQRFQAQQIVPEIILDNDLIDLPENWPEFD